jgi:hypothetical protein
MGAGKEPPRKDQALLVEYQVCGQLASSSISQYWTIAGIFMGVSSALLAALVFGALANAELVKTLLGENGTLETAKPLIAATALILGLAVMIILCLLGRWLKRLHFLLDLYYGRMREIELGQGMRIGWRINALDRWREVRVKRKVECRAQLWCSLKPELARGVSAEGISLLDGMKEELTGLVTDYFGRGGRARYERPSRTWHQPGLFIALLVIWFGVVLCGLALLFQYITWWVVLPGAIAILVFVEYFGVLGRLVSRNNLSLQE